jgi:transcriptional regulator with XRE-family HTH domain
MHKYHNAKIASDKLLVAIRKLREFRNINREQMSEEIGLSASGYSKIERGEIELSVHRFFVISEILKVDMGRLLNFEISGLVEPYKADMSMIALPLEVSKAPSDMHIGAYIQSLEAEILALKSQLADLNQQDWQVQANR